MIQITTLHTFNTEYPADSVEFCPNEGHRDYLACGTYNLEESRDSSTLPSRRKGTIILFRFDNQTREFNELFRCQTAAILDMKWLPPLLKASGTAFEIPTLATANALGQIDVYTLESDRLHLRASVECNAECAHLLALSLDWDWPNTCTTATSPRRILASDSKGDVTLIEYTVEDAPSYKLKKLKTWEAHNFEAWICCFDKWDKNLVYTGGDDIMIHAFDLRSYQRVLTNRSHIAGVTTMLSHPKREHVLLTGSYDERMLVFDTRSMRYPIGEINLQGGIWRLKSDPYNGDLILAACMYKNFSIARLPVIGSEENIPKLVGVYNEHKSICYGADWFLNINIHGNQARELYMATCSFYDNKLCISSVEL